MKYLLAGISILIFSCTELPTFERNNNNDPKSEFFQPDTSNSFSENQNTTETSIISSSGNVEAFERIIALKWPESEGDNFSYKVSRVDMYDQEEVLGIFKKGVNSLNDTISQTGRYRYEIKTIREDYEFNHSFGEVSFSHIVQGPEMHTDKHWWGVDVTQLDENRVLVTDPTIYVNNTSEIYDFRTNSWKFVQNPPNNDIPRTHIISETRAVRLDKTGYSFFDLEDLTWSNSTNWELNKFFYSTYFDSENILLTVLEGSESYLFNSVNGTLSRVSDIPEMNQNYELIKVKEDISLVIGGRLEEGKSYNIEKFDLNTKSWTRLKDLIVGFQNPRAHVLSNTEVLIFDRNFTGDNQSKVLKYNFDSGNQEVVGILKSGQPFLTRVPNDPIYSFPSKNSEEVLFFIYPTIDEAVIAYQIYNQKLNKLSRVINLMREDSFGNLSINNYLTLLTGWGILPNGDILLISERGKTAIFRF